MEKIVPKGTAAEELEATRKKLMTMKTVNRVLEISLGQEKEIPRDQGGGHQNVRFPAVASKHLVQACRGESGHDSKQHEQNYQRGDKGPSVRGRKEAQPGKG